MTPRPTRAPATRYSFTVTDPGADTFVLVDRLRRQRRPGRTDTFNSTTGAGSFVCSFPDGPAARHRQVTSATPTAPTATPTLDHGRHRQRQPTVTLTGCADGRRGHDPDLQLHRSPIRVHDTFTRSRPPAAPTAPRSRIRHVQPDHRVGSFDCFFPDGAGHDQRDRHRHRLRRRQRHRQPGRSSSTISQRRPDGHPGGRQRPAVDEGSQPHLQLHHQRSGRRTRSPCSRPTAASTARQVGVDTFNTATGAGSFVCSFPDGPASSTVSGPVEDSRRRDSNTDTLRRRHRQRQADRRPER